jgi:hypothetical protein
MQDEEGPDGLYYRDDFNDSPWACSLGTSEEHGVWMNTSDKAGTIMSLLVWLLLGTFPVTVTVPTHVMWYPSIALMTYTTSVIRIFRQSIRP